MVRKSLKQVYGGLRIKHKVFAVIALVMTVCFSITYFALQYAYSIYDEQLYTKSSQVLNLSSNAVEQELQRIERLSFSIATDSEIQGYLKAITPETPSYELLRLRSYTNDRLIQYTGYEKNLYAVEVIDSLGQETRAGVSRPVSTETKQRLIQEAEAAFGENLWIYPEQSGDSLLAVRQIRSYQNLDLEPLGTLLIHIRLDRIVNGVVAGTELQRGEMVITAGGSVIYPQDRTSPVIEASSKVNGHQGYLIEEVNGRSYFFTHLRSAYAGWTYYSLIPFDHIFTRIIIMKNVLLGVFIGSLVALMGLALAFARSITKPMEKLIARMKQVQKGNFSQAEWETTELSAHQMDEVGHLLRAFRIMVQQINELITENYAKQLTIKETQFKALQAQINPHFMYNTLESINWLAKSNNQPAISSMVESLGFLLRSSISMKKSLIPLREELEVISHYITIQKFRFEERLDFQMDIPDPLHEYCIPKLTLQPLIENAIHYALEPKIDPCRIRLTAVLDTERLILKVEDNGMGMNAELLAQVRSGEVRSRGTGIGLKNIEERIVLAFGESYGISIDSELGRGTAVYVRLPYEKGCSHV